MKVFLNKKVTPSSLGVYTKEETENLDQSNLSSANSYTDQEILEIKSYTDEKVAEKCSLFRFSNINITADMWVSDTTYTDFPYKAVISTPGVTDTCYGDIIFDEILKPNCIDSGETGTDTVTIWGKEVLDGTIIEIVCWR